MKKHLVLLLLTFFSAPFFGQDIARYRTLCADAYKLYEEKKFLESGFMYNNAFAALGHKGYADDRYNAACSWAMAGRSDSAFTQLFKIAEKAKFSNLAHMTADSDLNSLHDDKRWAEVVAKVKANKEQSEKDLDKPLVAMLDCVYITDQRYRLHMREVQDKYGYESPEMKALWKMQNYYDSVNLVSVRKIIDERGWLGPEVIGQQGNSALFLVIQHSDQATQEKYLPMMREAVKNKKASASSLALLEDRVLLGQGKKQIYGSQIGSGPKEGEYHVRPLEDPDNVDKRRAEVGLGPLAEYAGHWNIKWNVEEYKKQLPELEK
jgi:hypothetical protein